MSITTILVLCGIRFSVAVNTAYYLCETSFDDQACVVQVECNTGRSTYDKDTGIFTIIKQKVVLEGCKKLSPQRTQLSIMGEFAAAISCIEDK
jgi:hypothetical protein